MQRCPGLSSCPCWCQTLHSLGATSHGCFLHPGLLIRLAFLVTKGLADAPDAVRAGQYLLVQPAWSIGLELWFYLLVPFLAYGVQAQW